MTATKALPPLDHETVEVHANEAGEMKVIHDSARLIAVTDVQVSSDGMVFLKLGGQLIRIGAAPANNIQRFRKARRSEIIYMPNGLPSNMRCMSVPVMAM